MDDKARTKGREKEEMGYLDVGSSHGARIPKIVDLYGGGASVEDVVSVASCPAIEVYYGQAKAKVRFKDAESQSGFRERKRCSWVEEKSDSRMT
jgi:hypothetical protein